MVIHFAVFNAALKSSDPWMVAAPAVSVDASRAVKMKKLIGKRIFDGVDFQMEANPDGGGWCSKSERQ
jgi:hypothetical protein